MKIAESELFIVGLGLMGGSLALALKGRFKKITGFDCDYETVKIATEQKIIDHAYATLEEGVKSANLICLATPVDTIVEYLDELKRVDTNKGEKFLFDIGSSKVEIIRKMEGLPNNFHAVGTHPICGKEKLGLLNADRTLYFGAPFLVSACSSTNEEILDVIREIVKVIGADFKSIEPELHDQALAIVSHIPYLLSSALVLSTPDVVKEYIGPGFLSSSRLAATSPRMMLPVLLSNRENILENLEKIVDELNLFISLIADDDVVELGLNLDRVKEIYMRLMSK